jgi:hypothetical protein
MFPFNFKAQPVNIKIFGFGYIKDAQDGNCFLKYTLKLRILMTGNNIGYPVLA